MNNHLTFSNMPLDRANSLRKNSTWLTEQALSNNSYFYFYYQSQFLYLENTLFTFSHSQLNNNTNLDALALNFNISENSTLTFLGLKNGSAYFMFDLSSMTNTELTLWLQNLQTYTQAYSHNNSDKKRDTNSNEKNDGNSDESSDKKSNTSKIAFIDFRRSLPLLNAEQAAILSYGKALIHWQQSAKFCGTCGHQTKSLDGGHQKQCLNNTCNIKQFPRTDPVVIMLVEYQPETGPAMCLLAEHHRAPAQHYSILAGFVDSGESLTEAVKREVFEEVGINVTDVRYVDSQPWPFPNTLMLGFIAKATNTTINLEKDELRNAAWFTAEQLKHVQHNSKNPNKPKLPKKESIARFLIDHWCKQQLL